jgi:uroporphyrinogen decarboxylase
MEGMTSQERMNAAMNFQESDRVPFVLSLTMHGAKELGLSLPEYYNKAENIIEGQLRMQKRYGHDALFAYLYSALDYEAWGGEASIRENGPANAGIPIISKKEDISQLNLPDIFSKSCVKKLLQVVSGLKAKSGGDVPVMGAITSPFSLPIMQLGFDRYIELIYQQEDLFWILMRLNSTFCLDLANAQYDSGADFVVYVDPMLSPELVPENIFCDKGMKVAKEILPRFKGPYGIHFGSAKMQPRLHDIAELSPAAVGISCNDDIKICKDITKGKAAVLGNLNGIAMTSWDSAHAAAEVKKAVAAGAAGGGYILSDTHGEIPFQVSDDVLGTIAETVKEYG